MSWLTSANILKNLGFKGFSINESLEWPISYQFVDLQDKLQHQSFCHKLDAPRAQQMEKVKGGNRLENGRSQLFFWCCHWHTMWPWRRRFSSLCFSFPPCYLYTQQKPTTWPLTTVIFAFWMASKQINQWQGMYTGIPQRISLFIQKTLVLSCPNNICLKYMLFQV